MTKMLNLYHGSQAIIEKPYFHGGKATNDFGYGFYCTEDIELAKEWACGNPDNNGIVNKYSIDVAGMIILDLTDGRYSILNWIALLLKFRTFNLSSEVSIEAKEYLLNKFSIDIDDFDIIIGHRADDSYFTFARDFLNNTISIRQLSEAMKLGGLGKQTVIVSKKAFDSLQFKGFEVVNGSEYYAKRKNRDAKARNDYVDKTRKTLLSKEDIFVIDIMRRELKDESL